MNPQDDDEDLSLQEALQFAERMQSSERVQDGWNVGFADGHARTIPWDTPKDRLQSWFLQADGLPVGNDQPNKLLQQIDKEKFPE